MGLALVSGAGSGIGKSTAELLSKNGFEIILVGRNRGRLEAVHNQLSTVSYILECDLSNAEQTKALALRVQQICESQPLDVLINNAGIFSRRPIADSDDELWRALWEGNFLAPVRLTRLLLPIMEKQKRGSIVNISSTLGLDPAAGTGAYSAAKAALVNWTKCLALEVAPYGLRANCICPGLVETPIHGLDRMSDEEREVRKVEMAAMQPLGRVGKPEEIAQSILYFCSPGSEWTTGAVLTVDGGISLT